jgi:hypothetical protein
MEKKVETFVPGTNTLTSCGDNKSVMHRRTGISIYVTTNMQAPRHEEPAVAKPSTATPVILAYIRII